MKYIRTKDGIYEIIEEVPSTKYDWRYYRDKNMIGKNMTIIKQADTIEELLNVFILKGIDLIHLNEEYTQYRFEESDEWFDITDTELRVGIYGAIWTDRGLIYVAKLNDKGELELI